MPAVLGFWFLLTSRVPAFRFFGFWFLGFWFWFLVFVCLIKKNKILVNQTNKNKKQIFNHVRPW